MFLRIFKSYFFHGFFNPKPGNCGGKCGGRENLLKPSIKIPITPKTPTSAINIDLFRLSRQRITVTTGLLSFTESPVKISQLLKEPVSKKLGNFVPCLRLLVVREVRKKGLHFRLNCTFELMLLGNYRSGLFDQSPNGKL